jgi:hypothetical protein
MPQIPFRSILKKSQWLGPARRPALLSWGESVPTGVICAVMDRPRDTRTACLAVPYRLPWQQLLSGELMAFPAAVI